MRVGIIDLLSMPASHWLEVPYRFLLTKQYASLMPQAIAVWCRQGSVTRFSMRRTTAMGTRLRRCPPTSTCSLCRDLPTSALQPNIRS